MMNQKRRNYKEFGVPAPSFMQASMEAWEAVGFNHCSWRLFEKQALVNGDIVDDFCSQHFSNGDQRLELERQNIERANQSVSNEALAILEAIAIRHPVLRHNVYDQRRTRIIRMLQQADMDVGGERRPHLHADVASAITGRSTDLPWLRDRGLQFGEVDPSLIGRPDTGRVPETSAIAAWCPVNSDRRAMLEATIAAPMAELFRSSPRQWLRSLQPGAVGL
jgi:hypothetical protein